MSLACTKCNGGKLQVLDTRPNQKRNVTVRRLVCTCGARYRSEERIVDGSIYERDTITKHALRLAFKQAIKDVLGTTEKPAE